jgi:hypothetical protein
MKTTAQTTRVFLATIAGSVALLALGAAGAAAAPAASQQATSQCWKDVVNDWLKHQPNLVGTYAIPCYTQAIQHLSAYPDLEGYSSATDDIHRALLAAIHQDRNNGPGSGPPASSGGSSGTPSSPSGGSDGGSGTSSSSDDRSLFGRAASSIGPGDAQSVPLPLIVLGGLALLLLLAAAGTWFARRLQNRRLPPAAASQDS